MCTYNDTLVTVSLLRRRMCIFSELDIVRLKKDLFRKRSFLFEIIVAPLIFFEGTALIHTWTSTSHNSYFLQYELVYNTKACDNSDILYPINLYIPHADLENSMCACKYGLR
jgi:hypothetical protein